MPNASELLINIVAKNTGLKKTLDDSTRDVKKFGDSVEKTSDKIGTLGNVIQGVFQGIGQAAINAFGRALSGAVGEIGKSISAASDLSESINKVGVAFGAAGQEIIDWSKDSATSLGQSQQQALEAASSFGLLFNTLGVGQDDAANMSKRLVTLATDMASINNIPIDEALQKLRSGLVGESEPLRAVGVLLSETAVQQEAVTLGLAASTDAVSEQSKVLARYQLILDQTAQTQGDFARTAGGIANQQRILSANLDNFRAQFGQAFTPIYSAILEGLNRLIAEVTPYGEGIIQALATGMTQGAIYLIQVMGQIRQLISYYLEAHSPPRLLPDLAKWGAAAMNAYLEGWGMADFGALKALGGAIEGILRSFVGAGKLGETDLVSTIFGSSNAIARAVDEFRRLGSVAPGTLDAIRRAAGPAGDAIGGLVESYFDLEQATRATTAAQRQLDDVTRAYDARLKPLNDKLTANQAAQQKIRDEQRLYELGKTQSDPAASASERRLARLEQEEILLRQQQSAVESERDTAVDAGKQKLDAAIKEQDAKQQIYDQQQAALDVQVKSNNLIAEEISLRERLAAEALAEQKQALAELEAEKRKADAADKERLAELERIYQAQLQYNLQIADTPGKIALLKLELGRYTEGSAEYYGILTQIASLEQSLAKERDKGGLGAIAGGGILPPVAKLDVPGWVTDLKKQLDAAIKTSFGPGGADPMAEFNKHFTGEGGGGKPKMSELVSNFVTAIENLTTAIGALKTGIDNATPVLTAFANALGLLPKAGEKGTGDFAHSVHTHLGEAEAYLTFSKDFWTLNWGNLWADLRRISDTDGQGTFTDVVVWMTDLGISFQAWGLKFLGDWILFWFNLGVEIGLWTKNTLTHFITWLGDLLKTLSDFDLGPAGESLMYGFFTGLSDYWNETIVPWWEARIAWLKSLLPGADAAAPPSIQQAPRPKQQQDLIPPGTVASINGGVVAASFTTGGGGLATTNNNSTFGPINVHFYGKVDEASGRAAVTGLDDELRRRGYKA